ncbi:amidohydrolase family protein [Roseiarcus sp.]|uniref:amidohydrolase family protein n=1 Tax=Roseiarcus sp. TaxID=1969460 RepID=UPI003F966980
MSQWDSVIRDLSRARKGYTLAGATALIGARGEAEKTDILIGGGGRIEAVGAPAARSDCPRLDLSNLTVSPALVDAHQHLDKTQTLKLASNPSGTLQGARDAFAAFARGVTPGNLAARAETTMRRCLTRGATAIRTHVNVDKDAGFVGVDVLSGLREQWADRMTLQCVAFMVPHPRQDYDWLAANIDAAALKADALGGTVAVAEDPERYLDIIFSAAVRHGKPIDLHMDEHLDAGRQRFDLVFERVRKFGMRGRVVLSHCSVLCAVPDDVFERIRDQILELDLGVITLPAANLYIQGRGQDLLPPRGLTRVAPLARAGVKIAAASDNIQDPFIPTGSGDMLEIARWTLLAGHLHASELPIAYGMATHVPAGLLGLGADYGIKAGARADLLITDCEDAERLVAGGPDRMIVLSRGRPIARGGSIAANL